MSKHKLTDTDIADIIYQKGLVKTRNMYTITVICIYCMYLNGDITYNENSEAVG